MLSNDLSTELIEYAHQFAPHEFCGLLFPDGPRELQIAPNRASDPTHGFLLHLDDYLDLCASHVERPWALVHSHPERSAGLSIKDCQLMDALQAAGSDLAMVIVGLKPVEIRCFKKVGELYSLQWAYWQNSEGEWCGPKMGTVIPMRRYERVLPAL